METKFNSRTASLESLKFVDSSYIVIMVLIVRFNMTGIKLRGVQRADICHQNKKGFYCLM